MLNRKKLRVLIATALVSCSLTGGISVQAAPMNSHYKKTNHINIEKQSEDNKKLTVMMYMDGDNNLEGPLLSDIQEMKRGYVDNPNLNLIVLIDRKKGESNDSRVLGENFTDTRMYKIEHNKAIRIDGGKEFSEITKTSTYEANMGDPNTLKKFINSCKANYKADKYVLMMSNHGGGCKEKQDKNKINKAICWDDTNNGDCLYMGEISDVLTRDQSVDVLGFDACLMGTAEVAYQYRPNNGGFQADTMIASSPTVWGAGYKYDKIFSRIRSGVSNSKETDLTLGGKEKYFNPSTITNNEIGALFVEEQRDSVSAAGDNSQELSCYDLSKAENLKNSVDNLARALSTENEKNDLGKLRGTVGYTSLMHYFDEQDEGDWISYPYFDLYDLCNKISSSNKYSKNIKSLAKDVMKNVDDMIVYSYGGSQYRGFTDGKNGLSIFFPDGSRNYVDYNSGQTIPHWFMQRWYNPNDTMAEGLVTPYGKLAWCKNGLDQSINKVGNWFELLDSWYDVSNNKIGGYNHYQW